MTRRNAIFTLFAIWCIGSSLSIALVLAQTVVGRYGDEVLHAWAWLLSTILPTLTFMATMLVAFDDSTPTATVRLGLFAWASVISVAYLILVVFTLFLQPFATIDPIRLFAISQLWLAPSQALALLLVTVFFIEP